MKNNFYWPLLYKRNNVGDFMGTNVESKNYNFH